MKKQLMVMLVLLVSTVVVKAAAYEELYDWQTVLNGNGSTSHYSAVSDGLNTYHVLSLNNSGAITMIDSQGNASTLVTTAEWAAASGETHITAFGNFSYDNGSLYFAESGSDAIWTVDVATGNLSELASKSAISTYTGQSGTQILTTGGANNGTFYFYEGMSDSILSVDSKGKITTYISDAELTGVAGTDSVSGGLAFDLTGNLVWGSNSTDSLYIWDNDTKSGSVLLDTAAITAVTSASSAGFGDMVTGSDGRVYFYDTASDGILSFDPVDSINTLRFELTEAELLAGPAAYDNVFGLTWHDDKLSFNIMGERGFYAVPEPATMLLLGLGGIAMIRRKKSETM